MSEAEQVAMEQKLLRREELALLGSFLATTAAISYALVLPLLLIVGAAGGVLFFVLRRGERVVAQSWVEAVVGGVALLGAIPLALRERESAPGLALFLLVTFCTKLVAPRGDRDRGLACLVSVVLGGVAASEAVEPVFAPMFLAWILSTLMFIVVRTARMQASAEPDMQPARWAGSARVHLGPQLRLLVMLTIGTIIFFYTFPRMGAKLLANPGRRSLQRMSGFTDRVGLDDIGRIKRNDAIAFRVETSDQTAEDLYWRGRALDHYDGETWRATLSLRWSGKKLLHDGPLGFYDPLFEPREGAEARRYTFYLEPIGTRCLFTLGEMEAIRFKTARPAGLFRDALGSVLMPNIYSAQIAYELTSFEPGDGEWRLHRILRRRARERCLKITAGVDRDRLQQYGEEAVGRRGLTPGSSPLRIARALEAHLSETYDYTVEGQRTPDTEPIEDFLFHKRKGHCELFASSHVMILRSMGIPARLVTGLRGSEFSEWSGMHTVRQSNAHAWSEVLTEEGWVRFDPTPAESAPSAVVGVVKLARDLADWLELRWFAWVIAFDAYDQNKLIRYVRETLSEWVAGMQERGMGGLLLGGLAALGLLLVSAPLFVLRKHWLGWLRAMAPGRSAVTGPGPGPSLQRLLVALRARGLERESWETPLEFARRAQAVLELKVSLSAWVTRCYYAERFGSNPLQEADLGRLEGILAALEG